MLAKERPTNDHLYVEYQTVGFHIAVGTKNLIKFDYEINLVVRDTLEIQQMNSVLQSFIMQPH